MNRYHYTLTVFIVVCALWAISGIDPVTPANWFAESKVYFWTLPVMAAIIAYVRLSKISVTLIGVFLVLHIIGMHYNYGNVPFGTWVGHLFGSDTNVYDRVVHFSFGFLMFYPVREVLLRMKGAPGFFGYFVPLNIILSFSALYEIMEWHTVSNLSSAVGFLFIGGNDPFDAQKDMTVALLGAVLSMIITFVAYAIRTKNVMVEIKKGLQSQRDIVTRSIYKKII